MPEAQAAPAANPEDSVSTSSFRTGLYRRNPDYDNYSVADFPKLSDVDLSSLLAILASKTNGYESIVPKSFTRQFGEDAVAKFSQVLASEAARRGRPASYAEALLNGAFDAISDTVIRTDIPFRLTTENTDGTTNQVMTTVPNAFNYAVSLEAIAAVNARSDNPNNYSPRTKVSVRVPPEAVAAVVAKHPELPKTLAAERIGYPSGDETAFFAGYASASGASREIGPIALDIFPKDYCEAPIIRNNIFRAGNKEVDFGDAFVAGVALRQLDGMTDAQYDSVIAACPIVSSGSVAKQ